MRRFIWGALLLSMSGAAIAAPNCLDRGQPLPIDNEKVLELKEKTNSGFRARARVEGQVGIVYEDKTGHDHFQIFIGRNNSDTLEVIYNQEFGRLPDLSEGIMVEACGDFINAKTRNGGYPPSPDGAIIHWVHASDNVGKHPDGYVMIEGRYYGGVGQNLTSLPCPSFEEDAEAAASCQQKLREKALSY